MILQRNVGCEGMRRKKQISLVIIDRKLVYLWNELKLEEQVIVKTMIESIKTKERIRRTFGSLLCCKNVVT